MSPHVMTAMKIGLQARISWRAWFALALFGVNAWELANMRVVPAKLQDARLAIPVQIPAGEQGRGNAGPAPDSANIWATAALERPLFSPNRSPYQVRPDLALKSPVIPRLTGILICSGIKLSFFVRAGGGSVSAPEGSDIGAFKILSISAGSVLVRGPAGVEEVHIAYDGAQRLSQLSKTVAPSLNDVTGSPWANSWTQP